MPLNPHCSSWKEIILGFSICQMQRLSLREVKQLTKAQESQDLDPVLCDPSHRCLVAPLAAPPFLLQPAILVGVSCGDTWPGSHAETPGPSVRHRSLQGQLRLSQTPFRSTSWLWSSLPQPPPSLALAPYP